MAKTIIQLIKAAASKLKDSKLARLGGKEISEILEALKNSLKLETREEAIVSQAFSTNQVVEGQPIWTGWLIISSVPPSI